MMKACVSYLVVCVLLLSTASWAEDWQEPLLPQQARPTAAVERLSSQNAMLSLLDHSTTLSLRPTFFAPAVAYGRLKDVVPDSDGARSKGLQASTNWLQGRLKAESEVAYRDSAEQTGGPQDERSRRMMRLTVTGMEGAFRYGASYRTAGKAYVDGADQGQREVWGEYKYGIARLRSAFGATWNNVDGDLTQPSATQTYGRVGMRLVRPHWPELSLTYTRALLNAHNSGGPPLQRAAIGTFEAALSFTRTTWQAQLASSYIRSDNQLPGSRDTTGLVETFTACYRPLNTLTVIPSLSYRADFDQWSGQRIDTPSASVAINYRATQRFFVSALGGYSVARSPDNVVGMESVNSRALVGWTIPTVGSWATPPIVAIEAGYSRMAQYSATPSDLQDVSGLLRLIVDEF